MSFGTVGSDLRTSPITSPPYGVVYEDGDGVSGSLLRYVVPTSLGVGLPARRLVSFATDRDSCTVKDEDLVGRSPTFRRSEMNTHLVHPILLAPPVSQGKRQKDRGRPVSLRVGEDCGRTRGLRTQPKLLSVPRTTRVVFRPPRVPCPADGSPWGPVSHRWASKAVPFGNSSLVPGCLPRRDVNSVAESPIGNLRWKRERGPFSPVLN